MWPFRLVPLRLDDAAPISSVSSSTVLWANATLLSNRALPFATLLRRSARTPMSSSPSSGTPQCHSSIPSYPTDVENITIGEKGVFNGLKVFPFLIGASCIEGKHLRWYDHLPTIPRLQVVWDRKGQGNRNPRCSRYVPHASPWSLL